MPGLDSIDGRQAIEAMQGINRAVRNPVFFVTYFLTPVIAAGVAALLYRDRRRAASGLLLASALIYAAGVLLPTGVINVPMNEALARIDVSAIATDAPKVWASYSSSWTLWNGVRAALSLVSTLFAAVALLRFHDGATR